MCIYIYIYIYICVYLWYELLEKKLLIFIYLLKVKKNLETFTSGLVSFISHHQSIWLTDQFKREITKGWEKKSSKKTQIEPNFHFFFSFSGNGNVYKRLKSYLGENIYFKKWSFLFTLNIWIILVVFKRSYLFLYIILIDMKFFKK